MVRLTNSDLGSVPDATVTIAVSNPFRADPGNFPAYRSLTGTVWPQTPTGNLQAAYSLRIYGRRI